METTDTTKNDSDGPNYPFAVFDLKKSITAYLKERGVNHFCKVTVTLKGRWFELSGKVDSYWTRSVLFSLVPKKNGRRFIIDKLQVVTFPEGSAWI